MKKRKMIDWFGLIGGLVLINFFAAKFHGRFDLTGEKRYSLSEPTKQALKNLDRPLQINVFLKGEYPAGFRKLTTSIEDFLHECKEYGGANFQYSFSDPLKNLSDSSAKYFIDSINYFYQIPVFTLQAPAKVGDEMTQKLVLPGAVIQYGDTTVGVSLLKGEKGYGTEPEQLAQLYNNIESSIEYKFASAIHKATTKEKPAVGYALGNGEAWGYNVDDVVRTLIKDYRFDTINLKTAPLIPPYDALVVIKPTQKFTDADKMKIDQYVVNGGKVFWMIDNMYAEFDSLYKSQGFVAYDRGLNLEDLLFHYGVRINQSLLQDMQSDKLPQVSTTGSNQRRLVDWPFFPVVNGTAHPISKNLDGVRLLFPTTIDTVEAKGISKTFLLESSDNARIMEAPAKIDFEFLQIAPDSKAFRLKKIPVSVLLEGKFTSLYSARMPKAFRDTLASLGYTVRNSNAATNKMILVADGDAAMNQFSSNTGPLPMGTNVFTNYTFANKDFFLNAMDYLVNPSDIIKTRSKAFVLRLLDPKKTEEEKTKWQVINIILPLLIILLAGFLFHYLRRQRYASVS